MYEEVYYSDGKRILFCDTNNNFIYLCGLCSYSHNRYQVISKTLYVSEKFIEGLVESYFISSHLENTCELYAAPIWWLNENNFKVIDKPKKDKKEVKKRTIKTKKK